MLDTTAYNVTFPDGTRYDFAANRTVQVINDNVVDNGNKCEVISGIIDNRKDDTAIKLDYSYITVNGRKKIKPTAQGWNLLLQ